MLQKLLALPRPLFVLGVLVVGLLFIILANPPHSLCTSQIEIFKKNQQGFLYKDPSKKFQKTLGVVKAVEDCKFSNSPGGCLDVFLGFKRLIADLQTAPLECQPELLSDESINKPFFGLIELMVRLAWGERVPASSLDRQGWLDLSHMKLYCDAKKLVYEHLGENRWNQFIEVQLRYLGSQSNISRQEVWARSILSYTCQ